jgi:hypothetical protein
MMLKEARSASDPRVLYWAAAIEVFPRLFFFSFLFYYYKLSTYRTQQESTTILLAEGQDTDLTWIVNYRLVIQVLDS